MTENTAENLHLILACDANYLPHAAVTLLSAVEHCSMPVDAHFLVNNSVTPRRQRKFCKVFSAKKSLKITFHNVAAAFSKKIPCNRLPVITYYRFLIPALFPDFERCIYLDTDILVLGDLAELYRLDVKNAMLAGVPDGGVQLVIRNRTRLSCGETADEYYREKIANPSQYINAGVLLFQLNEIRARGENVFREMFQMCNHFFEFNDQDILNIRLQDEIAVLEEKWNYQNNLPPGGKRTETPLVFHHKPWCLEDIPHVSNRYWEYLRQTPYEAAVLGEYLLHAVSVSVKRLPGLRLWNLPRLLGNVLASAVRRCGK